MPLAWAFAQAFARTAGSTSLDVETSRDYTVIMTSLVLLCTPVTVVRWLNAVASEVGKHACATSSGTSRPAASGSRIITWPRLPLHPPLATIYLKVWLRCDISAFDRPSFIRFAKRIGCDGTAEPACRLAAGVTT